LHGVASGEAAGASGRAPPRDTAPAPAPAPAPAEEVDEEGAPPRAAGAAGRRDSPCRSSRCCACSAPWHSSRSSGVGGAWWGWAAAVEEVMPVAWWAAAAEEVTPVAWWAAAAEEVVLLAVAVEAALAAGRGAGAQGRSIGSSGVKGGAWRAAEGAAAAAEAGPAAGRGGAEVKAKAAGARLQGVPPCAGAGLGVSGSLGIKVSGFQGLRVLGSRGVRASGLQAWIGGACEAAGLCTGWGQV
jgi:hypothetical protein